ncbi:parathyroid hormone [Etheostoma spectabile]|uniref:parathyroid hormone n=1 Tax=Etheostoma spectabile TaxID=54343 RepID=UPI0013AFD118|nr:parathyroid hormone-like [Etheostoma spectabile]
MALTANLSLLLELIEDIGQQVLSDDRELEVNMRNPDYKLVFISLCILHLFTLCEARPLRKRTVSEVQLMHNLGELKQVQERQVWLQMKLQGIYVPPTWGSSGETGRTRRRLRPEELPDLSDMTPEEIQ